MHLAGRNGLRLLLALILLASFVIRPPGTMLSLEGEKISYILCTAGEPEIVKVLLDGEVDQTIDLSCEFFAAQIAALSIDAPDASPVRSRVVRLAPVPHLVAAELRPLWHPHTARAPPLVS